MKRFYSLPVLLALLYLAIVHQASAECGVYDRMVTKHDNFCNKNNDDYPVHIGEESVHNTGWQWSLTVDESAKAKCKDSLPSTSDLPTSAKLDFKAIVKSASKSSCRCYGRYELIRSNSSDATDTTTYTVLYLQPDRVDDPYYSFTKEVIQKLLKHQYYYLYMSHFFKSADQYFPNVAGFFRGYVDRALEMAENGIKYTIAKKETLSLMHGLTEEERSHHNYPMYDIFHHDKDTMFPLHLKMDTEHFFLGGVPDDQITDIGMIEKAFKQAVHWEKTIMSELVRVSMLADSICDTELAEYISAEMMPGQRTTLKLLESHRMTLKRMESSGRVAEFLFDSQL